MARTLSTETLTNVAAKIAQFRAALTDLRAENESFDKAIESKTLTITGKRDAMARINRAESALAEHGNYIASLVGNFVAHIATNDPDALLKVVTSLGEHLPQLVAVANNAKSEAKTLREQQREAEINAAVEARMAVIQKAKVQK